MSMHKGLLGQSGGGASVDMKTYNPDGWKDGFPVTPHTKERTLGDYIARKTRHDAFTAVAAEKKLTFEEWWSQQLPVYEDKPFEYMVDAAEAAWQAAQENK